MRFGVADYGMNVWDGGNFDQEAKWAALQGIGYDGIERLYATGEMHAFHAAAAMRKLGFGFGTCLGPTPEASIQWTAALGKDYVWTAVSANDFDGFCRQAQLHGRAAKRWGVQAAVHNHLGSRAESQEQVEEFLARCPSCGLILDTAHLAVPGGDPVEMVRKYADRLAAVHLKDWIETDPEVGLDQWWARGRFCELGAGNIGIDNLAVMAALVEVGYDGWVFVEHDTHLQDPLKDLAISRGVLADAGF